MAEAHGVGAQLGPRIIGRLTPEVILRSPQYMNPVSQYEIDLRGNRIAAIENLGTTEVRAARRPRPPASPALGRLPHCRSFSPRVHCRTSSTA